MPTQDLRRTQILRAALEVIAERGYPETRIADVAQRVEISPALVMYYFKTKDTLLAEATRYAEDLWYAEGTRRMSAIDSAAGRLEELVRMTCIPESGEGLGESWSVWLDVWAQALRHDEVRNVREEFDEHWRETIRRIVRDGQAAGEFDSVDVEDFALTLSALLDGFAVQIALGDPVVGIDRCFELSMRFAAGELGFTWQAQTGGADGRRSAVGDNTATLSTSGRVPTTSDGKTPSISKIKGPAKSAGRR